MMSWNERKLHLNEAIHAEISAFCTGTFLATLKRKTALGSSCRTGKTSICTLVLPCHIFHQISAKFVHEGTFKETCSALIGEKAHPWSGGRLSLAKLQEDGCQYFKKVVGDRHAYIPSAWTGACRSCWQKGAVERQLHKNLQFPDGSQTTTASPSNGVINLWMMILCFSAFSRLFTIESAIPEDISCTAK